MNKKEIVDHVFCPLVDIEIEDIDCLVTRDVVDGMLKESAIVDMFKEKPDWQEICLKCKWHNY